MVDKYHLGPSPGAISLCGSQAGAQVSSFKRLPLLLTTVVVPSKDPAVNVALPCWILV